MTKDKRPIIGLTVDYVDPAQEPGGDWYAKLPWYALRHTYTQAIAHAGGVPILLPYHHDGLNDYLSILDGLVVTGGGFDVDPKLYGADYHHPTVAVKRIRTDFEWAITKAMLSVDKPVLGICGGMQLLNVLHGGTLIQHIPEEAPSQINHTQDHSRYEPQHMVQVAAGTLLNKLIGNSDSIHVNSVHHQAIKEVAPTLRINAHAPDGLIEGIESPHQRFCLGVQWHPEFHVSPADVSILKGFINACGN